MRKIARLAMAFMLLMGALSVMPGTSRVFSPDAVAQIVPTPTLPPIFGGGDDEDGGSGGGSGGGGGLLGGDDDEPAPDPGGGSGGSGGDDTPVNIDKDEDPSPDGGKVKGGKKGKGDQKLEAPQEITDPYTGSSHIGGSFSTARLVAVATKLRALGVDPDKVVKAVYTPFIIGGEAAWTDTWGAPRFGPGPIRRTHEGQDVFCRMGDPVLAPEDGVVSYSDGGLGGITARVHTSTSTYFYMTHLSETNADEYPAGSRVEAGDVVGACGNTGNAITTPPHVHFGWYVNGDAQNPMRKLVSWLRIAERRVLGSLEVHERKAVRASSLRTIERLFGDAFAPDLSELDGTEALVGLSASNPTVGALAVFGQSLQQAFDGTTIATEDSFDPGTFAVEHSD